MADPEELVATLAQQSISEFPAEMDWPLVAAGAVAAGGDEFAATSVNVMHVSEGTSFRLVHAEEVLFEKLEEDAGDEEIEVVITLEPCRERQGEGDASTPCCQRIIEFAKNRSVKRVIAGMFADGRGLRAMALAGLPVVLLHGEEHAVWIRKDPARRVEQINAEVGRCGGVDVELRLVGALDCVNRAAVERRERFNAEVQESSDRILVWLGEESKDPGKNLISGLLTTFGGFFDAGDRELLGSRIPGWRSAPSEPVDLRRARAFVEKQVYVVLSRERSLRIEAELRERRGYDAE